MAQPQSDEQSAPVARSPRSHVRQVVRAVFLLVALTACGLVIWNNREDVAAALADMSLLVAGPAFVAAFVAGVVPMLGWRVLLRDLGSPLPLGAAGRIYYVSQLGKYIPGTVWILLAQMELAREYRVPVRRSGSVALLALVTALFSAVLVVATALPFSTAAVRDRYWWVVLLLPPLLVFLHPGVVAWWSRWLFRIVRRPAEPGRLRGRAVVASVGWMVVAWLCYGVHLFWLVEDASPGDGPADLRTLAQCIGVFSLAWVVGFLLVFLPAGAGARELVLVLGLASVLPAGAALAVALVSRVMLTLVDVLLALAAVGRHRMLRAHAG